MRFIVINQYIPWLHQMFIEKRETKTFSFTKTTRFMNAASRVPVEVFSAASQQLMIDEKSLPNRRIFGKYDKCICLSLLKH